MRLPVEVVQREARQQSRRKELVDSMGVEVFDY